MQRIELPNVDAEDRKRLSEELKLSRELPLRMAMAFIAGNKHFFGAKKTGKHADGSAGQKTRTKAKRRAKGKVAKRSRKVNRNA